MKSREIMRNHVESRKHEGKSTYAHKGKGNTSHGQKGKGKGEDGRSSPNSTLQPAHSTTSARATNETKRFPGWAHPPQPPISILVFVAVSSVDHLSRLHKTSRSTPSRGPQLDVECSNLFSCLYLSEVWVIVD